MTAKIFDLFTGKEIKGRSLKLLQVSAQGVRLIEAEGPRRSENKFSEGNAERLLSALARKGV